MLASTFAITHAFHRHIEISKPVIVVRIVLPLVEDTAVRYDTERLKSKQNINTIYVYV
jgi:hypothetical protein